MDKKILDQIQKRVVADKDNQELFAAYDAMDRMDWDLPSTMVKDWVRKRISTDAHDALKTMTDIFDTYNPKWEILPLGENDINRAERLTAWLEYHMVKANQAGAVSPFRKALHYSGKFNRVILEVDYLPYWLPKDKEAWTKEQKANSLHSPFCVTAHDPRCIYYEIGKYGLKWIANIANMTAVEVAEHWGIYESDSEEGRQIKRGLAKIKDEECNFIYLDYTSNSKRIVAVFKTEYEDTANFAEIGSDDAVIILDTENKLGFIPYAVAGGDSDPLLYSMHISGVWENQNLIDTIVDSSVLRRGFFPLLQHQSPTGKDLDINYDGTQDVVELGMGEQVGTLVPPPIDTGLQQLAQINANRMGQTAGIRNLGLQDIAGNVQFSTVQAQIQLQLTKLQPYKRTAEKGLAQAGLIAFRWLDFAGTTEVAYRKTPRGGGIERGQEVAVNSDDFDPDVMQVTCELLSAAPTDKQSLVNMYATLKQSGAQIAWGELLERLQLGNPEILKQGWLKEQVEAIALQQYGKQKDAALNLQMQQAQQAMQLEAQQAMTQQAMPPEQSGAMANPNTQDPMMQGGQMNNPAAGGQPPIMEAPGMTRNNVRDAG